METNQQQQIQPKNIFEVINLNVYNLSQNINDLYALMTKTAQKIDEMHSILFAQPTVAGDAPKEENE